MLLKYWFDIGWRMKTPRDRRQVLGQGMVATLRYAMQQQHIPLQLDTGMESLIEQDGRVVGVVVEHNGKTLRYQAKHGVILACGGFESNQQMRDQYLAKPTTVEWRSEGRRVGKEGVSTCRSRGSPDH